MIARIARHYRFYVIPRLLSSVILPSDQTWLQSNSGSPFSCAASESAKVLTTSGRHNLIPEKRALLLAHDAAVAHCSTLFVVVVIHSFPRILLLICTFILTVEHSLAKLVSEINVLLLLRIGLNLVEPLASAAFESVFPCRHISYYAFCRSVGGFKLFVSSNVALSFKINPSL